MAAPKKKAAPKAKPKAKAKPAAKGPPSPALVADVPDTTLACPLPPANPKHVVVVPGDAVVGDHIACKINHHLRVKSLSPLRVVPG